MNDNVKDKKVNNIVNDSLHVSQMTYLLFKWINHIMFLEHNLMVNGGCPLPGVWPNSYYKYH